MNSLSIFDQKWIDLVFEEKNKEYGAYQLRKENSNTSIKAFGIAITILLSCLGIFTLSSFLSVNNVENIEPDLSIKVDLAHIENPKPNIIQPKSELPKSTKIFSKETILINPIITKPTEVLENLATNAAIGIISNKVPTTNTVATGTNTGISENITIVKPAVNNEILSVKSLDKQPSFPNGMDKFYSYVGNNFKTPEINDEKTVTVKVFFVVEKDGSMSNISVTDDPGYGLAAEAIRVLKTLKTKWSPGILNGEPVRTAYNLPILVKLE